MRNLKKSLNRAFSLYPAISVALMFIIFSVIQSQFILACQQQLIFGLCILGLRCVNSNNGNDFIFTGCGFWEKEVYYIQFIIPRKTGGIAL